MRPLWRHNSLQLTTKNTSKRHITGPSRVGIPTQRASNAGSVSVLWRPPCPIALQMPCPTPDSSQTTVIIQQAYYNCYHSCIMVGGAGFVVAINVCFTNTMT